MTIAIEFLTIEDRDAFLRETAPEGFDFYAEFTNEDPHQAAFTIFSSIVLPFALSYGATWLYDVMKKHNAKGATIDGKKADDEATFKKIVSAGDLDIGKND